MKKSDLKTGMHLELRNGQIRVVLLGVLYSNKSIDTTAQVKDNSGFDRLFNYFDLFNWSDNLLSSCNEGTRLDIMKVKAPYGDLLWERKEEKTILELDGIEYSESTLRSIIKKATE